MLMFTYIEQESVSNFAYDILAVRWPKRRVVDLTLEYLYNLWSSLETSSFSLNIIRCPKDCAEDLVVGHYVKAAEAVISFNYIYGI